VLYEPYYVGKMPLPLYDETFVGYGQDKVEQVYELAAHKVPCLCVSPSVCVCVCVCVLSDIMPCVLFLFVCNCVIM